VATASLELGIDIGEVDLVCQMGSPRSIASFLQRVGRSGHAVDGTPKGRLFPLSRDELVECAALLQSVERGELDRISIPEQPLDVLAQQIAAEVAAQEWAEDDLLALFRRAWPYRALSREDFMAIVVMLAEGFSTAAAGAAPSSITMRSTRCSAAGAGRASRRSPPAARFRTRPTIRSCWSRRARSSAR
jgi:Lhr-like helicases